MESELGYYAIYRFDVNMPRFAFRKFYSNFFLDMIASSLGQTPIKCSKRTIKINSVGTKLVLMRCS